MKKVFHILLAATFIAFVLPAAAQTDSQPEVITVEEIAQTGSISFATQTPSALPQNNEIFITQIGDNNNSSIAAISSTSTITVNQFGNTNSAELFIDSPSIISYDVSQIGNRNQLLESTPFFSSNSAINIQTIQTGNNNLIDKFGSNELTENMTITQTGDNMTMIVRSF
ncbi:MAG: hypothetical protein KTR13_08470 [Saprospiraceae bacterium]|nr:hypothetical protein [Saprospiraceae bacterium]